MERKCLHKKILMVFPCKADEMTIFHVRMILCDFSSYILKFTFEYFIWNENNGTLMIICCPNDRNKGFYTEMIIKIVLVFSYKSKVNYILATISS